MSLGRMLNMAPEIYKETATENDPSAYENVKEDEMRAKRNC